MRAWAENSVVSRWFYSTVKGEVPKSCWETVSAFSNTAGGWLVFGVSQKGKSFEIVGVNHPEKLE